MYENKYFFIAVAVAAILAIVAMTMLAGRIGFHQNGPQAQNATGTSSSNTATSGSITNSSVQNVTIGRNGSGGIAVDLAEELNNSANAGFKLNSSYFAASSASACVKQQISSCDNNVPSQFICVNGNYSGDVRGQYSSIYSNNTQRACPLFMMAGTVSCAISAGYCVVAGSSP